VLKEGQNCLKIERIRFPGRLSSSEQKLFRNRRNFHNFGKSNTIQFIQKRRQTGYM